MNKKKKQIIIPFSGGYDSLYLTLKILESTKEKNDDSEIVLISVINQCIAKTKTTREIAAREKIINCLKDEGYTFKVIEITRTYKDLNIKRGKQNDFYLTQPLLWISEAVFESDPNKSTIIALGYISGDHAPIFTHEIRTAVNMFATINSKEIQVDFPILGLTKKDILINLYNEHKEYLDIATSCEDWADEKDHCGACVPCRHLKDAMVGIILDKYYYEDMRTYFALKLYDYFGIDLRSVYMVDSATFHKIDSHLSIN